MQSDVLALNLSVNRDSAIPLYYQLKEQIKNLILNGVFMPNDQLPTEEELCESLSISRPVVRQAYGELIKENLIGRRKGSGTYVMDVAQKYYLKEYLMFSFEKSLKLGDSSKVTKLEEISDENQIKTFSFIDEVDNLRITSQWNSIYHVEKVFYLFGQPQLVSNSYVIGKFAPKFDRCFEDASKMAIVELFEKNYGIRLVKACRCVNAKIPDDEIKETLNIKNDSLVYVIETKYYDELSRLIIVEYATMTTANTSFNVEIKR